MADDDEGATPRDAGATPDHVHRAPGGADRAPGGTGPAPGDERPAPGGATPARRRWLLVAAVAGVLVVLGAASADGDARTPAGNPGLRDFAVRPAYHGHVVTADDVAELRAQGLAAASALNRELACQGVELYFDTAAERDAYLADYATRFPAEPPYLTADPCRPYRDSPRYVDGE